MTCLCRHRGGRWYSSNVFASRYYKEAGGQQHAPAVLPPGITRYPLYSRHHNVYRVKLYGRNNAEVKKMKYTSINVILTNLRNSDSNRIQKLYPSTYTSGYHLWVPYILVRVPFKFYGIFVLGGSGLIGNFLWIRVDRHFLWIRVDMHFCGSGLICTFVDQGW
jgi:hypothetical protein